MSEIEQNGVRLYQFPLDDETLAEVNRGMNSHVPFAVVASSDFVKTGNKVTRARQYPWGIVQGESCNAMRKYLLGLFSGVKSIPTPSGLTILPISLIIHSNMTVLKGDHGILYLYSPWISNNLLFHSIQNDIPNWSSIHFINKKCSHANCSKPSG